MNWHTETRKISELKNWEDNPRTISKEAFKELKESIGELGNFEPLVINIDGTVLAGNQRLKVYIESGIEEVEVSVPERELTDEEIKKVGVISNKHSGEWDMDKLAESFGDMLEELGLEELLDNTQEDDFYTQKIEPPIYEPKGEKPDIKELFDDTRYRNILNKLEHSNINNELKDFLRLGATRFISFDYSKIAEFYSHLEEEEREYFREQALIIVDYNKAIELGFVRFLKDMEDIVEEEENE